jgi:pimeloyl-ACP methyl ester carboxylesterase
MKKLLRRSLVLMLGGALFFAVVALAVSWAPDKPLEALKARWAPPPSRFVEIGGMQVHLRDEGPRDDPAPIVLLHGTSASLHTWEGWAQALRGQRRVIRFDLPGFALTGPNPQQDYSTETYVRFVGDVMTRLGVPRFVIGGNSLGGQIAWSVAAALPERVDRLILVDSSGYPPESMVSQQSVPLGFRIARTPALRPLMRNLLPRGVVQASVDSVYGDPSKVTPELVDLYMDMALREGNRQALGQRLDQGYTADTSRLATLKLPTLILWGGRDRLVPPEFGQWFHRDIRGSQLVVFPALGHVPQEEDPVRTVAEVRKFLGL